MEDKTPTIVCPICGQVYHPAEIFIPKEFFGDPKEVIRTTSGKIDFITGKDMCLDETYVCDNCLTPLTIHANLSFTITPSTEKNFSEDYISSYKKLEKLRLEETSLFDD